MLRYCRDVDDSQSIRLDEFMTYFEVEDSKFNRGMFGMFGDEDGGQISFIEFVVIMFNFLTIPLDKLSSFAFMLLSSDEVFLSPAKIIALLNMIHTKESLKGHNIKAQIDDLQAMNWDIFYNVEQFAEFIKYEAYYFCMSRMAYMALSLFHSTHFTLPLINCVMCSYPSIVKQETNVLNCSYC
jgi:hypothetical protein